MTATRDTVFYEFCRSGSTYYLELRWRTNNHLLTPLDLADLNPLPHGFFIDTHPVNPAFGAIFSKTHTRMNLNRAFKDAGFFQNVEDIAKTTDFYDRQTKFNKRHDLIMIQKTQTGSKSSE